MKLSEVDQFNLGKVILRKKVTLITLLTESKAPTENSKKGIAIKNIQTSRMISDPF